MTQLRSIILQNILYYNMDSPQCYLYALSPASTVIVKPQFNVSLWICGSENSTEDNLKRINYNTEITDLEGMKLYAK